MDKYMLCSDCGTIVSGGFGYTGVDGKNKFACMSCTMKKHSTYANTANLNVAANFDPNKKES